MEWLKQTIELVRKRDPAALKRFAIFIAAFTVALVVIFRVSALPKPDKPRQLNPL